MSLTLGNRILTGWPAGLLIAALAGGFGATAPSHFPGATAPILSHAAAVTLRQQNAVTRYWTPARMREALRNAWSDGNTLGDGLRWVHGGAVTRTTGKVFFTLHGTNYVCSGSVVDSARQDVVLTAAHCTGDGSGDWASNWTFVPGYSDGAQPYGVYTARRFYVSARWDEMGDSSSARSEKYDVAFVTVNPASAATRSGAGVRAVAGRRLGQVTGGQPVTFGGSPRGRDTYVFGYPSDPPFTGLYPDYCAGLARQAPEGAVSLPCTMTAGDSGGPWFTGFGPRAGTGTITGISTYKYGNGGQTLYGTVLGPDAETLYKEAVFSK